MRVLGRLLGYLRPYWARVVLAAFSLVGGTAMGLVVPWVIKQVIDVGLARGDPMAIFLSALTIVGLGVVRALFGFGQRYLSEWLSHRVAYDLRNRLYDRIQRLPFAYHDHTPIGQLISRATSDVESVQRFVGFGLVDGINTLLLAVSILVILFRTNRELALIALAPLPILVVVAIRFGRIIRPMFLGVHRQLARVSEVVQENLVGIPVVKAFAREPYEMQKFDAVNRELLVRRLRLIRTWAANFPLMAVLISLSTALILWYGGRQVIAGRMTVGEVVAFNSYVVMLAMPVQRLGWIVNLTAMAMTAGQRIFEVLDTEPTIRNRPGAIVLPRLRGEVRFERVSFRYQGAGGLFRPDDGRPPPEPGAWILREVSFEARPGQVIALLGETGSGKSTLVNLIPRFYEATSGRVLVDGYDVREVTLESLRRQIGIVLQEPFLFSATVRENIAYGRPDAPLEAIVEAARAAHAHDFIVELPEGYDTLVGERGVTLSGGQRQRVAIARALLMDPRILILDDATSSVDVETEHLIQEALARLMEGRTTFVIAHRISTVRRADLILVLEGGRIVERGTHAELLAQGRRYAEICRLQLTSLPGLPVGP
ncbi:MAG: ABC transporter ATP-binding protein [Chloroflexi bacterium]|nr:MAG: ABC transporter ATP-binding protein [Chloroflexota bacterium]